MVVFVKYRRSESKCFKRSYVFADCNGCVLLRTQGKIEKRYCISLRTAMIVFVKCRRSESKCFIFVSQSRFSLYAFACCNDSAPYASEKERKRGNRRKCVKSWLRVAERCDEFFICS